MTAVVAIPDADVPPSARQVEGEWTAWFEPRQAEDFFESPFHHELVEVRIPGEVCTRAIAPVDLPSDVDPADVFWRPMPWADARGGKLRFYSSLYEPGAVFGGEDGHIFHRINLACEQIFDGVGLTDDGCRRWIEVLERRSEWCAARGIEYRMLIIPEHHTLYADKVPGRPALSPDRPVMRLLRAVPGHVRDNIIYPYETMLAGRAKYETSYPHDVHFTRYGAFLCYRQLMQSLPGFTPERVVEEEQLVPKTRMVAGDVARAYGDPGRMMEWFDPPRVKSRTVFKSSALTDSQVNVFETGEHELPRLTMFRTSNSGQLFDFLFRHVSRLTAVSGLKVYFDLLESEAPQIMITEMPERYLAGRPPRNDEDRDLCNVNADAQSGFEREFGCALPLPGTPGA